MNECIMLLPKKLTGVSQLQKREKQWKQPYGRDYCIMRSKK